MLRTEESALFHTKRQFTMLILRNMVYIGMGKIFYKHSYGIKIIILEHVSICVELINMQNYYMD
jgi:hypothetical protein